MAFNISYTYQIIDKYTAQLAKITKATREYTTAARKASSAAKTLQTSLTGVNKRAGATSRSFKTTATRTQRLATAMRTLKNTSANVGTNLQAAAAASSKFNKSMRPGGAGGGGAPAVKGFSSRLRNASRDLLGFRGILFSMFVGAGAKKALSTFADFETTMNMISAVSLASPKDMSKLRGVIKNLGLTTMFTNTQVAEAALNLKKLGLTMPEVETALPKTLQLAAASGMQLAAAADLGVVTTKQFHMELSELGHVNDVLALAQAKSGSTIEQFGQSLSKAGFMAKVANIDFETTVAALGMMGDVGVRGGRAGTYMMNLIRMVQSPRKETAAVFDFLLGGSGKGDAFAKQISGKGTEGFLKLIEIVQKVPQLEKKMLKLFGIRGGLGGIILSGAGASNIREFAASLREVDAFAKIAAGKRLGGLPGAFLMLKSAVEAVTLAFFDSGLADIIENFSKKITGFARTIARANPKVLKFIGVIALVTITVMGVMVVLALLISTLGVLFTPFGAYVGMVTALAASFALAYSESEAFQGMVLTLWSALGLLGESIADLFDAFDTGPSEDGGFSAFQAWLEIITASIYVATSALAGFIHMSAAMFKFASFDWEGGAVSYSAGLEKLNLGKAWDDAMINMRPELAPGIRPRDQQMGLSGSIDVRALPGTEVAGSSLSGTEGFDVGMNNLGYSGGW